MKRFHVVIDAHLSAEDIDDAVAKLALHFLAAITQDYEIPTILESHSELSIHPEELCDHDFRKPPPSESEDAR